MGTTPNFGWTYPAPTNYVKDLPSDLGDLADEIDATVAGLGSGLTLVKTQTIGSAVSSVAVTSAFSTTYDNYKILISGGVGSGTAYMKLQLGASTTGYRYSVISGNFDASGNATYQGSTSAANFIYVGDFGTAYNHMNCDVSAPYLAKPTAVNATYCYDGGGGIAGSMTGLHTVATSYTDFTILTSSGTLTGGTIYVYGYQK